MKNFLSFLCAVAFTALIGCQVVAGDQSINEYSSDAAITANVKTALLANKRIASLPIHVATEKGMVVLSGFVKTNNQKIAAGQSVLKIKEVKMLRNNLIVR
ncbi:MAG: BON domain-containing protein [Tatlockia sp.]|nr:BON domain-containing protein [Tatlockia sp.]